MGVKKINTKDGPKLQNTKTGKLAGSAPKKASVPTAKSTSAEPAFVYPKWSLPRDGEAYDEQLTRKLTPEDSKERKWSDEEAKKTEKWLKKDPEYNVPKINLSPVLEAKGKRTKTSDGNHGYVQGAAATSKDGKLWIHLHHTRVLPGQSYMEWEAVRDDGDDPISIYSSGSSGTTLEGKTVRGKLGANKKGYWIRVRVGQTKDKEYLWEWTQIKTTSNDLRRLQKSLS